MNVTAAPKHPLLLVRALGAFVLAAALLLVWTAPARAAGRSILASTAPKGGGDPGKGKGDGHGDKGGHGDNKGNGHNDGNGSGNGNGKGKGKGKGGDDGDIAPTPNNPSPTPPPPPTPPTPPAPSNPSPPPAPDNPSPPPAPTHGTTPPAPPPSPDPASSPSNLNSPDPGPSAPDPTPSSPDPSTPGSPDPTPSSPDPPPSHPSSPDTAPSPPVAVVGATSGTGTTDGPSVAPPSSPPSTPSAPSARPAPPPPAPTVAALPSFRLAQPVPGGVSPQNVGANPANLRSAFAQVVFTFKRLLHLWGGNHAGLTMRRDGIGGTIAILVSLVGRAPMFSIATHSPVSTHAAGVRYHLNAWLRTANPGATLCLRAQEVTKRGHVVRTTERCVAGGANWQHYRLGTRSLAGGHKLRFSVYELGALPGDSFEVGGLSAGHAGR